MREELDMNKIGMIADDLTGANDSGVQLVKKDYDHLLFLIYIHYLLIKVILGPLSLTQIVEIKVKTKHMRLF